MLDETYGIHLITCIFITVSPRNMPQVPSNYGDLHRRFLQVLMNRRMISYEDAFHLFCKIYQSEECKTFSFIFNDCVQIY
jgi:hypothetical protein